MAVPQRYGPDFFERTGAGSGRSAAIIVPIIVELLSPSSIIDVGCGRGTWLAAFWRHGVRDICGVDGDWIDESALEIPTDRLVRADLSAPLTLGRRFDLVVSLEVAEHLPQSSADDFVGSLTALGSSVLFSAAIPFQGGIGHVNEQWPEYWACRFEERGYLAVDCIRPCVWNVSEVEWWYAQNAILFVHHQSVASNERLADMVRRTDSRQLSRVHPRQYLAARHAVDDVYFRPDPNKVCLSTLVTLFPRVVANAVSRRLGFRR